jgi:hypothetical protein
MSTRRAILMGGALLLAVTFGAEAASRLLFAPWSIGFGGRTTLTGPWAGSLKTRQGAEYGLYLALEYRSRSTSYRGSGAISASGSTNLQGHAMLCTPTGERYAYEISGTADPVGRIGGLWLEYGDPGLSGLNMQLTGAWRGGALDLTITKNPFLPDGRLLAARTSSRSEPDDPDDYFAPATLTERDRAAFEATCRRIRV